MKGVKAVVEKIKLGLSETQFMKLRRFFNVTVETTGSVNGVAIPRQFFFSEKFLRHIFTGELEVLMESSGRILSDLSGFHHDFGCKDIGKGLLKLTNKTYDRTGRILQAHVIDGDGLIKTFFPKNWSSEKVAEKIVEALKNIEKVNRETGGRVRFIGQTKCGMRVQFVAKKSGKLITAFPAI